MQLHPNIDYKNNKKAKKKKKNFQYYIHSYIITHEYINVTHKELSSTGNFGYRNSKTISYTCKIEFVCV